MFELYVYIYTHHMNIVSYSYIPCLQSPYGC